MPQSPNTNSPNTKVDPASPEFTQEQIDEILGLNEDFPALSLAAHSHANVDEPGTSRMMMNLTAEPMDTSGVPETQAPIVPEIAVPAQHVPADPENIPVQPTVPVPLMNIQLNQHNFRRAHHFRRQPPYHFQPTNFHRVFRPANQFRNVIRPTNLYRVRDFRGNFVPVCFLCCQIGHISKYCRNV
jgi:hypothetical protein